jgi:hypothetical protein
MVVDTGVTVGFPPIVIVPTAVFVQPAADVPVTVYEVVLAGLAVKEALTVLVGVHVYVLPPPPTIVPLPPAQTVVLLAVIVGGPLTSTVCVIVATQVPLPVAVKLTVYVPAPP